jgi:uncharacterized protein (DUF1499 family)
MRWIVAVIAAVAIILAAAIAVAGPGARLGLWDYGVGLQIIRAVAAPKPIVGGLALSPLFTAAALALLAVIAAAARKQKRQAGLALIAALLAGGAAVVPIKMRADFEANPFIHDITTDFDDPPAIVAAADSPRKNPPDYRGGDTVPNDASGLTVAEAQKQAFPDIAPIVVEADLARAAAAAADAVRSMGMEILADGPAGALSGSGWRIEAVATSFWFGFKDDFIVRLTPENGRTRVDIRSKSRVGGSDLGANARRVREFSKRLRARFEPAG